MGKGEEEEVEEEKGGANRLTSERELQCHELKKSFWDSTVKRVMHLVRGS